MNDKAIRKILIAFLKTKFREIRIYQEKSIGGSICDLMAVADCLIGFEIKSDLDNFARIDKQIYNYNDFFDFNYIVVGKNHKETVRSKVPYNWGIIVIEEDNVTVTRKPQKNNKYNIKKKLSVLWKLELKNLLNYFRLPMYAQRSSEFIVDRLAESVQPEELSKRVTYELMHRDYSIYDAQDYTQYYKNVDFSDFDYQRFELMDNVSEMDLQQVTLDEWIEIYRKAKAVGAIKEEKVKEHLPRPEHEITYKDIEVSPGVPWVSKRIIQDFVYYIVRKDHKYPDHNVNYEPITGNWFIGNKNSANYYPSCISKYGIKEYNALYILEATLNLREIKIHKNNKYDEETTLAALEKQRVVNELFKNWVWLDEDRKWEIEEAYNNLFGKYKKQHYDGSGLEFPDMNKDYELFDYQKDAVQKIISNSNTLLAFDVGAGKTYIMIAAAMLMRQQGLSRKNMFVVPNNIVGQWEKMFTELYPSARLFVIEPKSFKAPVRDKVIRQMKYGDYDGIIIAYSCFEMIPLSIKYIQSRMHEKLGMLNAAIRRIGYERGSQAALTKERDNIIKLTHELIEDMDYDPEMLTFDELEINTLFLDEAHNYKNVPIRTKLRNLRGINTKGSLKCYEMLQKVRSVQVSDKGHGVVFATGSPLCNSLADAYTMQMYLQYEDMERNRLEVFDNWVKTFAKPEKVAEVDVDAQHYRYVTRFSKFFNLPELSRMFSDVAVFHAMETEDGLPETEGYTDCVIEKNDDLTAYMLFLASRTDTIREGGVSPKEDNMLKVSTDGRKAALDLRLVKKEQPSETSKITECTKNVKRIYDENADCAQLIFCDYSTPKKDEFNVYREIKDRLINMGIPDKEIAFIHSYKTEERKVALYENVNAGKVRVLIGSTFKLGIGVNVQQRLKAIHHLDVPWRPADMIQREGRIIRKGNTYENVYIFRYVCEGSFDAYSWQILENKQKFISQFLMGSAYQREAKDLEENVLSYAEVKALALSDPRMRTLAEKENELTNIRILNNKFIESRRNMTIDIENAGSDIKNLRELIQASEINREELADKSKSDYKELRKELSDILIPESIIEENILLGEFWGYKIFTPNAQRQTKPIILLKKNGAVYRIEMGDSHTGNALRVTNFLESLDKFIEERHKMIKEKQDYIEQAKQASAENNPYTEQLKQLEKQVIGLRHELSNAV